MDLNMGLAQALSDGTNTYVYGVGRIAQVNTGTEYFLGDALGSVRQLTNASGTITYARAYDPYGVVTTTFGSSQSTYGYTGEYSGDYNELVYLRARHYAPSMGRFLTRDTWGGDYSRPLSLNRWMYGYGNPVKYTDPTGLTPSKMGYVEGFSISQATELAGQGGIGGMEIVYDYATMTRARFKYSGTVGGLYATYLGASIYTGEIFGFTYDSSARSRTLITEIRTENQPRA